MTRRWLNQTTPVPRGILIAGFLWTWAYILDDPRPAGIATLVMIAALVTHLADWLDNR